MASYRITLKDRSVEVIDGADAYQQEGQMTTFFATRQGRDVVDCWSTRVASFRTSEVIVIRREDERLQRLQPGGADGASFAEADDARGEAPGVAQGEAPGEARRRLRSA